MAPPIRRTLALTTAMLLAVAGAETEETLQDPRPQEHVKVERTQFEVIVWPPKDDVALCASLTRADFDLLLSPRPFSDFDVDPLDLQAEAQTHAAPADATTPRLVALLYDWWGLERGTDEYSPRERAFVQARAFIETHPMDRFVILALGNDATFRSTVFEPGPEALATLDRFEADINATGFLIPGPHLDTRNWRNGVLGG